MTRPRLMLGTAILASAIPLVAARQAVQAPAFEVDPLWPRPLPNRWVLGSVVGVAVDARDHVYIVHQHQSLNPRTEIGAAQNPPTGECCVPAPSVLEFDAAGNLVSSWGGKGDGFRWPVANHGIAVDRQGNIWIGGSGGVDTQLLKFDRTGRLLLAIGKAADSAAIAAATRQPPADTTYAGVSGGRPPASAQRPPTLAADNANLGAFGGAASVSFDAASGEAFVADGYRNRRVAVVDLNTGAVKRYWTGSGREFGSPVSCAEVARDGLVYVCDRANQRIQVFRKDGTFVREAAVNAAWDIAFSPDQRFLYIADGTNHKVRILERASLREIGSFGRPGRYPGQFYAVHSVAVDSRGNVYTAETLEGKRVQKWRRR